MTSPALILFRSFMTTQTNTIPAVYFVTGVGDILRAENLNTNSRILELLIGRLGNIELEGGLILSGTPGTTSGAIWYDNVSGTVKVYISATEQHTLLATSADPIPINRIPYIDSNGVIQFLGAPEDNTALVYNGTNFVWQSLSEIASQEFRNDIRYAADTNIVLQPNSMFELLGTSENSYLGYIQTNNMTGMINAYLRPRLYRFQAPPAQQGEDAVAALWLELTYGGSSNSNEPSNLSNSQTIEIFRAEVQRSTTMNERRLDNHDYEDNIYYVTNIPITSHPYTHFFLYERSVNAMSGGPTFFSGTLEFRHAGLVLPNIASP